MAFLEPHEKIWRGESGKYFTLSEVCSKPDTVAPFDGVCGFSPRLTEYSGTIFRFPLRSVASDLSDQLYDLDKLKKLFNALKCEGKHLLLFLRSVDTVEVYEIDSHGQQSMRFKTSIANKERDNIYARRIKFLQAVQQGYAANKYSIKRYIPLTLDFTITVEDEVVTEHHCIVVSQVGSSNQGVLQRASSYQILPWVGAAMETGGSQNAAGKGRVFCFLPMPAEASSPLPIHVNGTFGLSDDRRTLKWQNSERQNDTAAEWNKVLVSEVLPPCYALLIRYAIDSLQMSCAEVYHIWPDTAIVRGTEWEPLLSSLFRILTANDRIVWTDVPKDTASLALTQGEWVSIARATFIPENLSLSQLVQVHNSLHHCGVKLAEAPATVYSALKYIGCPVNYLTPTLAKEKLKTNHGCYRNLDSNKKYDLLMYCTSDNQYNTLIGLELLPLANNTFTVFQQKTNYSQPIYVCNSSYPRELFPNRDHLIVSTQNVSALNELIKIASSNWTQVQVMDQPSAVRLIKQCFHSQWQQQQQVTMRSSDTSFPATWFTTFWKWVQTYNLQEFAGEMVVPLGIEPTACVHSFEVTRLSSKSPVLYLTYNDVYHQQACLLTGLQKLPLRITSTQAHPHLVHKHLDTYVNRLTPGGILDALSNSCNEQFTQLHGVTFTMNEAYQLCVLLSQLTQTQLTPPRYKVLLNLPIFCTLNQPSALCNVFASAQASWGKKAMVQPLELPLSAKHLPDSLVIFPPLPQQFPLLRLLSDHVQVPTVMQFILNTLLPMISQGAYKPLSSMDAIMSEIIMQLPSWKRHYPSDIPALLRSLSELPFLPVGDNTCSQRRRPKDLYDPSNGELMALFHGEQVFPCAPFNEHSHLLPLRECGLMTEASSQALMNIIASISLPFSGAPQPVDPVRYSRAKAVLGYLSSHPILNGAQLAQMAKSSSWLPINCSAPKGYPSCLQWKGSIYKSHFTSLTTSFIPSTETCDLPLVLGSQVFVIDGLVPHSISSAFNTVSLGPLVVEHFKEVIAYHGGIAVTCLEKIVHLTYQYLSKQPAPNLLLQGLPTWVYIKGKFVSPQVVAVEANGSFSQDLTPYVHILPESLASYQDLFTQCGVEMSLTHRQICSVLEMMHSGGGSEVSPERAWNIVVSILNWLTSNGEQMVQLCDGETLYVPIECDSKGPSLENFTKVTYSDNEFLRNTLSAAGEGLPHIFLNHRVASLAHCLHLSPLSDHMSITEDAFVEDAGQHEPLTVRLKNILKEYKDGLTIVKEMLQNADDAGATELNVCYDARTHATERRTLFFPDMEDSHGPALVIHNNSIFTDDDFKNITKLAGATKEGSPLKIGKFGVGFCSVYHITDVPSFISRDYLHIFDPTLRYLKGAVKDITKPGKKLNLSHPILRSSKQLQPYQGLFGFSSQQSYSGTMFRLPFRSSPSEISSTMYSKHTIDEMVSDLKKCSSELVLFLQHITKITFSLIEADSSAPRCLVEIQRTSQQCRGSSLVTVTTRENGGLSSSKVWLVSFSEEDISGKRGIGSVACLLEACEGRYEVQRCIGETFCFLPLSKSTGLPVHVSANFAVLTNRRGIWAEDSHTPHSTTESQWNLALMESVVPKAYHCLLEALKGLVQEDKLTGYVFHFLWPLDKDLEQHHPWTTLIAALYRKISSGQLMYSCNTSRWLTVGDSRFIAPSIFAISSAHADTPPCIVEAIKALGTPVVDLPLVYRAYLDLRQSTITEQVFVTIFFQGIELFNNMQECRNEVLVTLLEVFAVEIGRNTPREKTLLSALEGNKCVPCSPCGATLKKCSELVDSQCIFASMYDDSDGKFPCIAACESDLARQAMLKLGLHHNSVPWEFIIERAQTIGSFFKVDSNKALKRIEYILQSIHKNMTLCSGGMVPEEAKTLASVSFLPVKQKPDGYPLPWLGDRCSRFHCGRDLVTFGSDTNMFCNVDLIAGSSVAILQQSTNGGFVPADVCNLLQIKTAPSCANVVAHFKQLITAVLQLESNTIPLVNQICDAIYSYFEVSLISNVQAEISEISEIRTLCSVWTGREFIHPNMVAKNWAWDGPYLFKIPTILDYRQKLVDFLHIQSSFTINDALRALVKMGDDFGNEPVNVECQHIITHIVPLLLEGEIDNMSQPVMLPDQAYIMCDASQLAFNDTPWCEADEGTRFLHDNIPRSLALKLGVKAVRSLIVEKYASLFEYKVDEEAFGQSEPLTRRIQNILQDYPNDETVLKELLQNADDAKANKMYIILDKRSHGNKVFNDSWKELQGPALLVWNSSVFSPKDLEGIQKLGLGGKRSDAETIGQYGIGFNAVYHLTDCPSFVSNGDTMCIFDPHCKYAPGANEVKPGRRFDRLKDGFWEKFPDLKSSYLQDGLHNSPQDLQNELKGGSLFRLPLRHTRDMVKASRIVPEQLNGARPPPLDTKEMQKLLFKWTPCIKQSMFFLNNITEIKFLVIEADSHHLDVIHHFTTRVDQADRKRLGEFKEAVHDFTSGSEPATVTYSLYLCDTQVLGDDTNKQRKEKKVEEKWLIQQGIGDIEEEMQTWSFIKQMKPRHGIAAPLEAAETIVGQVYCFLPLPILSHLPVHINGHFALNTARRDLWKSTDPKRPGSDDPRHTWNKNIISAITSSYRKFLLEGRRYFIKQEGYSTYDQVFADLARYYKLFPAIKDIWQDLAKDVYKKLTKHNSKVLAVPDQERLHLLLPPDDDNMTEGTAPMLCVKWHALHSATLQGQAHFFKVATNTLYHHSKHKQSAARPVASYVRALEQTAASTAIMPANGHSGTHLSNQPPRTGHLCLEGPAQSGVPSIANDNDDNIRHILEMTGMVITCAPLRIRAQLTTCGLTLPITTPQAVLSYYHLYHDQVLLHGEKFPCDVDDTKFTTVANFKGFLKYILHEEKHSAAFVDETAANGDETTDNDGNEATASEGDQTTARGDQITARGDQTTASEGDQTTARGDQSTARGDQVTSRGDQTVARGDQTTANQRDKLSGCKKEMSTVGDRGDSKLPPFPEGIPLLMTADQKIRKFDKKALILNSKFSHIFPTSLDRFLHPDLVPLNMVSHYFLTAASDTIDAYYKQNLHAMMCQILPDELLDVQAEDSLLDEDILKSLWKCFTMDAVFMSCLDIIVQTWAVLPSASNGLFSIRSPVLPIVEPSKQSPQYDNIRDIVDILHSLGMPFLKQWIPPKANMYCPQIEQHSKVLLNLVNLHKRSLINASSADIKIIVKYFQNIKFQEEPECAGLVRQLPLFQDIFGNLTDLSAKAAYVISNNVELCLEGVEECLKKSGAVLLDPAGEWKVLNPANINVTVIENEELYTKCIFNNFGSLNEDQRYKHLKHIRDHVYKKSCAVVKTFAPDHDCYQKAQSFVNSLKTLRCLGPDNSLKPVSDFCDHRHRIFHICKEKYNFLPDIFNSPCDEEMKWLEFFLELGLKKAILEQDFVQLVKAVASGQCDIPIEEASSLLVNRLLDPVAQFNDGCLHKVSGMPFVPVKKLEHLTWIAPACAAPHRLQKGQETIDMAALRGSYSGRAEGLVWTIMPVISLPYFFSTHVLEKALGFIMKPSFEDVLKNIVQVSKGPLSNRALFDQASQETVISKDGTDLVTVISSIFEFLKSVNDDEHPRLLKVLHTLPCIPVHAQVPNSWVLVEPSQVVARDEASRYYPFLHCLPHSLHVHLDTILQKIGVKKSIEPVHMRIVLEMAHKQSDQLHLDINTLRTVHKSLKTLYTLLKKLKGNNVPNLSPLYLPDQSGKLCPSTSLVYCDNVQYSHKVLEFSSAGLSMFLLPPQLGVQEEEFCSLLPEAVRPQCISRCITKVRHMELLPVATPLVDQLQQTLKMPEVIKAIVKIIEHLTGGGDIIMGIHSDLTCILSSIQVSCVHDLSNSISITHPACSIGTIKLKYELADESGKCHLYIDSSRQSPVSCKLVCDAMSDLVVKRLESFSRHQTYDVLLRLKEYISTLLMVQRLEDIQEVLQTLNLRLDSREISYHDLEPKLGDPIPPMWHHRLDQALGNIFRPQEWVGYETEDETIVFAQVVHRVEPSDDTSDKLNIKYRVYITDDDIIGVIVSSLSLYKFLRGSSRPDVSSNAIGQVLVASVQPNVPRVDVTAHEAMLQLNRELKEIWKLSENERKRAFKRYYLEWHPDKNPTRVQLAEEVYKYLRQQISRLEKGLPLQDPPTQPAEQPVQCNDPRESPSPKWQPYFTEWDKTAHSHQQSQRSEEQNSSKPGASSSAHHSPPEWQPDADPTQGKLWISQADSDWEAVCVLLGQASTNPAIPCHVCFHAYEVVSKVVRGGLMTVCGLRERGSTQENLVHQAMALEAEVPQLKGCLVHNVEVLVRYETCTRFPQRGQPAPVRMFNIEHAKAAERHACAVLRAVKDAILMR